MKILTWRGTLITSILAIALVYLLPTVCPDCWPHKKINLGLDLQGGMNLVLEVQSEKAVETTLERTIHELKKELRDGDVKHSGISLNAGNTITAVLSGKENIDGFNKILSENFNTLMINSTQKQGEATTMVLKLPDKEQESIRKMATEQALETIRNRIDEFGVSEPDIRIQGENRILVQLPGVTDTQRAKDLIGRTARLNFQLVDETGDVASALKGTPPPGDSILYQVKTNPQTGQTIKTPFLIKNRVLLDGSSLTDARVMIDSQYNEPYVGIEFDRKGARLFERITGENIKKRLAIVLDKTVYSAPVIQDRIAGGKARITGNFTTEEARDLAIALRAGALPAPVKILEERTVGPTLGADSIRMGIVSMIVGGLLVIIFMAIYYKGSGLIADFALIMNIILIGGGLAAFQATLTLPGIAGIILTIGMAVDANVIIFERIREELFSGKTPAASVKAGFERATLTVLDANVTTLIVAVVLFQFGTGPIKGFAVTLGLGIVASLFTALVLSKSCFDFFISGKKVSTLSI
ncbi:SecD [Desulforapulum autotrophicum HRM2]|uniref:Protein translocase subunit SecD n=1 Tax=Desulforapulum autotrophicum (strain ATCC 43914 / DSM 3382 / VKM B-1955 / HRM2) TaxID=177437 RepID=C0QI79_DESAH|nr:protein translocase subunit SecD [Desulforapulum autotrophicum]ACN15815.1 SecD [Desulforapulum autotrophicum HRM2]